MDIKSNSFLIDLFHTYSFIFHLGLTINHHIHDTINKYSKTSLTRVSGTWKPIQTQDIAKAPAFLPQVLTKISFNNDSTIFSVENWIPLKPVLGGRERCCTFHNLSWTDSIKPSLQFSFFLPWFCCSWGTDFYHNFSLTWGPR